MSAPQPAGRFIVIGGNIHASRVVRRDGRHVVTLPGGQEAVGFADGTGAPRALMLPDSIRDSLRGRYRLLLHLNQFLFLELIEGPIDLPLPGIKQRANGITAEGKIAGHRLQGGNSRQR